MQNDFSHLLSSLTVALKEADDIYKNRADPVLSDYTVTEMHCIENIGKTESPNVTKLAAAMNLTRGGVSKMIKKILKKGAAEAYTDEANKKENSGAKTMKRSLNVSARRKSLSENGS